MQNVLNHSLCRLEVNDRFSNYVEDDVIMDVSAYTVARRNLPPIWKGTTAVAVTKYAPGMHILMRSRSRLISA